MPEKDLTVAQRSTLLTLMIKAKPLPNTFFRNVAKISLDKPKRDELERFGLITVAQKPIVLELTEKGWARAIGELGAEAPPRAGAIGNTLYLLLDFLRGYLDHHDLAAAEFFTMRAQAPSVVLDLETQVRKAYAELAPRSGDWVMLEALRGALTGASREDVDATLIRLSRKPDVHLIPESNQKVLTAAERTAAISIGNQDKHLISIGS